MVKNNSNSRRIDKLKPNIYELKPLIYEFNIPFNEKIICWTIK